MKLIERSEPFDVIICDYHMPYIDGLETIRMMREKLEMPPDRPPIIILHSSSDDVRLHEECKNLGVHRWLTKSIIQRAFPSATIIEAENGKKAVELTARTEPNIIFMDVQMPEMDGNDATMAIRRMEENTDGVRIPIIGLTAGAMKEEREKSLAAGMDDFITKPIDIERLRGIVRAYLESDTVVHFEKQEFIEAVEDRELMTEMLQVAKEEIPQRIDSMATALDADNYTEAAALAHRVKGTALVLRCDRLAEVAGELERRAKSEEAEEARQALRKIQAEWKELLPLLNISDH